MFKPSRIFMLLHRHYHDHVIIIVIVIVIIIIKIVINSVLRDKSPRTRITTGVFVKHLQKYKEHNITNVKISCIVSRTNCPFFISLVSRNNDALLFSSPLHPSLPNRAFTCLMQHVQQTAFRLVEYSTIAMRYFNCALSD